MSAVGWWLCGSSHVFPYGDKAWHQDFIQGFELGYMVPQMCQWEDESGPCMDSSHLYGPYRGRHEAESAQVLVNRVKNLVDNAPPLSLEQKQRLRDIFLGPERLGLHEQRIETLDLERATLEAFRAGALDE